MAHLSTTPETLAPRLHRPDAPLILDLRDAGDAAADPRRIPGARPMSLVALETADLPPGEVICSCQKGGKLSQLAAAMVNDRGGRARWLAGGHLAWIAADAPTLTAGPLPARWLIPNDPDWAELAALWVLHRLIDRTARVLPVERTWLPAATEVWDADPLPSTATALADRAGLTHPAIPELAGGPARLLRGRLARVTSPVQALDLIDDWLATPMTEDPA